MRATVTVVTAISGAREDAVIEAPSGTPSGGVAAELGRLVGAAPSDAVLIDGIPIDPMAPIDQAGWHDGAIVGFGLRPQDPVVTERGYLELRVVGGPAAGSVHPVAPGSVTIGRGAGCDVVLDDRDVSRRHAVLTVTPDGAYVADLASTNGTLVDGRLAGERPVQIRPGTHIRVGESTLELAVPDNAPVALAPMGDGHRAFNPPPRLDAPDPGSDSSTLEFPEPPVQRATARLPIIATAAPLVAGVALAAIMRRPEYLLFTALSPVMMGGQWLADRVGNRRIERAEKAAYDTALAAAQALLAEQLNTERAGRRKTAPDPATVSAIATGPSVRLWERRPGDNDFLRVRLGTGRLPSDIRVSGANIEPAFLDDVPVTLPLARVGVLGIAGPVSRTGALARALLGQLATLQSPRELGIVVLTEGARAEAWEWVRWLPHVQPAATGNCQALVGVDRETSTARITELAALVNARRSRNGPHTQRRTVVVVVDGAYALRNTPGFADLLANGPAHGVFAICLDTDDARLPRECAAVATSTGAVATRLRLRGDSASHLEDAIADGVSISWAERVARALAPLREHTAATESEALPEAVGWLDIADLRGVDGAGIADELVERWGRTTGGRTTAVLGAAVDGPFSIDIARDGPHALIAGTTGSGKSELLQTIVASLAAANRPDELCFVLVDYKGGAAFGSCSSLPHTVGFVTDLDGGLAERALVSLTAELKRRETLLADEGVADIGAYRSAGRRLHRLVIVVDEFASLAEELPDFVGGLVGIAQRGRSLGVHLVLATQRPEGVVSADIRAKTNLRICLAVMRESESRDVIDVPDAAWISRATPGRAFARTGHGEVHAFQTGRVGGQANDRATQKVTACLAPFRALAHPEPGRSVTAAANGTTDLDLIVDACRAAAARLNVEPPASPWLPPLPEVVVATREDDASLRVVLGVRDLPARQSREPYVVDLSTFGHLVITGSARSGRTSALRTLAGVLARTTSVADLHIYAFDCTGGSLAAIGALPHCGAVVSSHEPQRARRLISILSAELARRQTILATQGFGSLAEQRLLGDEPLAHVGVFIDGWEAFNTAFEEVDSGAVVDALFRILREGAAVGLHVFVTADRGGLVGRLASTVENRLVLRLADRGDFSLIGLPARAVPTNLPAGRGFLAHDLVETQLCLLAGDAAGSAQLSALTAIAAAATARDFDVPIARRPRRVDELPSRVTLTDISRRLPSQRAGEVVLGVGGDELDAVRIDLLESGPGFVVAGPPRSGRSTALATIAVGLRAAGWHTVAVTARPSPLGAFVDLAVDASAPSIETVFRSATQRVAVLVDDAELVTDSPAARFLDRFTRQARDAGNLVAIAGTTDDLSIGFRGFVVEARRSRTGVLLTPRGPLDGEALGIRLPRDTGGRLPPGRGVLVTRGEATSLHLAMPA